MPGNPTAAAPPLPSLFPAFISFDDDDDDDGFGEFESAPVSSSQPQEKQEEEKDDEWGDFVVSPLRNLPNQSASSSTLSSSFFDSFSAPHAPRLDPSPIRPETAISAEKKAWEKPAGALPLSLFGEGDEDEEGSSNSVDNPPLSLPPFSSSKPPVSNGVAVGFGGGLRDLIAGLYGQTENKIGPVAAAVGINGRNGNGADGARSDSVAARDDDEFDEDWEFQDALSDTLGGDLGGSQLKEEEKLADAPLVETNSTTNGGGIQVVGNRCENVHGLDHPLRACNGEQEWGDAFASCDKSIANFGHGSTVTAHNCIPIPRHEIELGNNENGISPNLANGDIVLDDSFGEFVDASSDFERVNYLYNQEKDQKVADHSCTEADSVISNGKFEVIDLAWENHLGSLSLSSFSNENQDPFESVDAHPHVHTSTQTAEDFNFGLVVDLNDVSNLYSQVDQAFVINSIRNPIDNGWNSHEAVVTSHIVKDDNNFDGNVSKFNVSFENKVKDDSSVPVNVDVVHVDFNISNEPTVEIFVDFYSRLKERSHSLVLHHINNLKKAHKFAALSDEELRTMDFDKEIQAAYSKLQCAAVFKNNYVEDHSPRDVSVSELLEVVQEPRFQALQAEYQLLEKIPLAEKDLSSAVWLFEHATTFLRILTSASIEEQQTYIVAWSKMVSACGQELQHGATIWARSLHANIHTQLLSESRGYRYFLALGEVYRVAEILRVSMILFKPWILLNPADSKGVLNCLEKCVEAWMDSGLKKALENLSGSVVPEEKDVIAELLESIKSISDINAHALQSRVSGSGEPICRLSLLPLGMLQDMKGVVWHGKHYFCKLANLWANVISYDPPELPHVHIG